MPVPISRIYTATPVLLIFFSSHAWRDHSHWSCYSEETKIRKREGEGIEDLIISYYSWFRLSIWDTLAPTRASGFEDNVLVLFRRGWCNELPSGSVFTSLASASMWAGVAFSIWLESSSIYALIRFSWGSDLVDFRLEDSESTFSFPGISCL